jgi:hypothetical protein
MVWLPLVDGFRTFCWGEIIEELRNIHKLKVVLGHGIVHGEVL